MTLFEIVLFPTSAAGILSNSLAIYLLLITPNFLEEPVHLYIASLSVVNILFLVTNTAIWVTNDWAGTFLLNDFFCQYEFYCYKALFYIMIGNYVIISLDRYLFTIGASKGRSVIFFVFILAILWITMLCAAIPIFKGYEIQTASSGSSMASQKKRRKDCLESSGVPMTQRWIETDGYLLALVICLAFYTRMAYILKTESNRLLASAELEWADALIAWCIAQVEIKRHAMKIAVTSCVIFFGCCAFPIFNNVAESFSWKLPDGVDKIELIFLQLAASLSSLIYSRYSYSLRKRWKELKRNMCCTTEPPVVEMPYPTPYISTPSLRSLEIQSQKPT